MALREELKQFSENAKKEMKQLYEKVKQRPLTCLICIVVIVTAAILLIAFPHWQVSGINNVTEKVTQENQSRATLAQILGGIAVGIGIYFAWGNLTIAREGQITDRFTRAIEQLGSKELEIRLGGIYALERIANESEKDYWPIMEILTAFVRKNSPAKIEDNEDEDQNVISMDIQAIIDIIGRCKYSSNKSKSNCLNLQRTYLSGAIFSSGDFSFVDFTESTIDYALFNNANLHGSYLVGADLSGACFDDANLKEVGCFGAYLEDADFAESNLEGAFFISTHLLGARFLTIDQLSKVKTLYKAELNPELEEELRSKGYSHLLDDEP